MRTEFFGDRDVDQALLVQRLERVDRVATGLAVDVDAVVVIGIDALLGQQGGEQPQVLRPFGEEAGQVVGARRLLELAGVLQHLLRAGRQLRRAVLVDQAGLGHQVHVDVPQIGVEVEGHAVELPLIGDALDGAIGEVLERHARLGILLRGDLGERADAGELRKPMLVHDEHVGRVAADHRGLDLIVVAVPVGRQLGDGDAVVRFREAANDRLDDARLADRGRDVAALGVADAEEAGEPEILTVLRRRGTGEDEARERQCAR